METYYTGTASFNKSSPMSSERWVVAGQCIDYTSSFDTSIHKFQTFYRTLDKMYENARANLQNHRHSTTIVLPYATRLLLHTNTRGLRWVDAFTYLY